MNKKIFFLLLCLNLILLYKIATINSNKSNIQKQMFSFEEIDFLGKNFLVNSYQQKIDELGVDLKEFSLFTIIPSNSCIKCILQESIYWQKISNETGIEHYILSINTDDKNLEFLFENINYELKRIKLPINYINRKILVEASSPTTLLLDRNNKINLYYKSEFNNEIKQKYFYDKIKQFTQR